MALCRHLLYLFLFIILTASGQLTGPNVCRESVIVNLSRVLSETYIENANCPGQQAPCILTRNKTEYYMDVKNFWFCCPGWSQTGNECSQPCPANTYGRGCNQTCSCTANTFCNPSLGCVCNPGYKTPNCTVPCDKGTYGYNCTQECTCLNGATCDPVNGSCSCTPGWMGADCNTTCPAGRFGADCVGNCSCGTHGSSCDHVTGSCTLFENPPPVIMEPDGSSEDFLLIIVPVLGCVTLVTIIVACILCYTINRQKKLIYTLTKRDESEDETPARDDHDNSQPGIQLTARTLVQTTQQGPDHADSDEQYETRITPSTVLELHTNEAAPGPSGLNAAHTNQLELRPSLPQHQEISREEGSPFYCGIDDDNHMSGRRMQGAL